MDFSQIFSISESGMEYQRLRLELIANNMANANTTRTASGDIYRPLEALAIAGDFDSLLEQGGALDGVQHVEIIEKNATPRKVFNPGHPHADAQGFVSLPNINPVDEMTNLMMATRAYEANVRVMNAAKTMAQRALEIGSR